MCVDECGLEKSCPFLPVAMFTRQKRVTMPHSCCSQKGAGNFPTKICRLGNHPANLACPSENFFCLIRKFFWNSSFFRHVFWARGKGHLPAHRLAMPVVKRYVMQLTADAILNPDDVLKEIMNTRNKYLSKLTSPITQGGGADKRWKTYVPDKTMKHGRRLICRQTREELENAVIEFFMRQEQQISSSDMTVEDCWQLWYDFKKTHNRKLKTTSLKMFRSDKIKFLDGTAFAKQKISILDEAAIEDYLIEQVERYQMTQNRTCQLAGYVKGIFFAAYRNHIIDNNPWDRVSLKPPCLCLRHHDK